MSDTEKTLDEIRAKLKLVHKTANDALEAAEEAGDLAERAANGVDRHEDDIRYLQTTLAGGQRRVLPKPGRPLKFTAAEVVEGFKAKKFFPARARIMVRRYAEKYPEWTDELFSTFAENYGDQTAREAQ